MRLVKPVLALALAGLMPALPSDAQGLKDFGSFHVGGRQVTLEGYPVTESVFTQGAAPTRIDPTSTSPCPTRASRGTATW